jgi:hypothetical protein
MCSIGTMDLELFHGCAYYRLMGFPWGNPLCMSLDLDMCSLYLPFPCTCAAVMLIHVMTCTVYNSGCKGTCLEYVQGEQVEGN